MDILSTLKVFIEDSLLINMENFRDCDFDELLGNRELNDFEKEWLRVFNDLETMIKTSKIGTKDEDTINKIREQAFKYAYSRTENPDLCGYVSDDFEILSKALLLDYNDEWLASLFSVYLGGFFPNGTLTINEYLGSLSDMLNTSN